MFFKLILLSLFKFLVEVHNLSFYAIPRIFQHFDGVNIE